MGLRYALTGGGSLAESYVATGGYMRSDPSLAVSDTIVVMIPALVTRSGVGFRLPTCSRSVTALPCWSVRAGRSAADISCCAMPTQRRIR